MDELTLQGASDLALIRAYQDGNIEALAYLLERRQKWLYNLAKRVTQDAVLAEDGLQESLLQIWRGARFFRGDSQVTTWMYQITFRCCIDLLRKEKVGTRVALSDEIGHFLTDPVEIESKVVDSLLIHGALLELEENHRQILKLIWLDELSYEEASTRLNLPLGTIKSRASRAQARLKQVIQEFLVETGN